MGRKVIISYSPNPKEVGKEVELDDDVAAAMVREGRARYVTDKDAKATKAAGTATKTTPAATGSA